MLYSEVTGPGGGEYTHVVPLGSRDVHARVNAVTASKGGGVPMWLSLMENDADTPAVGGTQWLWNYSAYSGGTMAVRGVTDDWEWREGYGNMAFTLTGSVVPVPGAALLGAIGLAVAGWRQRRLR